MFSTDSSRAANLAFERHRGGKLETRTKVPLRTRADLAAAYTPGFAHVAAAIARNPEDLYRFSMKSNAVAIVTDGSAVSGLGDLGPEAALPVMEGKAILFKEFAGIDAFPICLATKDVDTIVRIVTCLEPTFGGVMLEDIGAPRCFEVEERLRAALSIPVLHDDQDATAIATTAALMNAVKIVRKGFSSLRIVIAGAGAAATALARLLIGLGVGEIVACDRQGAIHRGRDNLNAAKRWFAEHTNAAQQSGSLGEIMTGADVFVGLSGPGILTRDDLRRMSRDPIVFALANPVPEIPPDMAVGVATVFATGGSDHPNQIDCSLCYPGMFRGALDCRTTTINEAMKFAAARAIASLVDEEALRQGCIVPSVFDGVAMHVARAVMHAAVETHVARVPFTAASPVEASPQCVEMGDTR